jgi:hypothetical protein
VGFEHGPQLHRILLQIVAHFSPDTQLSAFS